MAGQRFDHAGEQLPQHISSTSRPLGRMLENPVGGQFAGQVLRSNDFGQAAAGLIQPPHAFGPETGQQARARQVVDLANRLEAQLPEQPERFRRQPQHGQRQVGHVRGGFAGQQSATRPAA